MAQQLREQARELVSRMTLEEKASLCSGKNFWESKAVERLGVKSFMLTDGPHGLRKQAGASDHLGLNASVPATCFPPAAATACSFDRALLREMGQAMGEECRAEEVGVILGPAANIKRSPLCGRNFEYFSEDPLVTGESAAGLIEGIQSQNVGACMKHYLANNQEKARLVSNSVVDQRALREIYLAGFEKAVKEAQPWTLMCSYNQINGTYASDHRELMTDVPRGEWGFEGAIMTDWGAMNDRVKAIQAGLDLEMPGPCDGNDEKIVQAVREGRLDEKLVDTCAARMVELALRVAQNSKTAYDQAAHHQLAGRAARESAVLLRRGSALPLAAGAKLAVIGDFARRPRYQGAGSSKINPTQLTSLCGALDERGVQYTYARGFEAEGGVDEALIAQAAQTAQGADVAVVTLGLPDSFESEGFDRAHMDLPENQNRLMEELLKTGTPIVAVLSNRVCGAAALAGADGQHPAAVPGRAEQRQRRGRPAAGQGQPLRQAGGELAAGAGGHPLPRLLWQGRQRGIPGERLRGLPLLRQGPQGGGLPLRPRPELYRFCVYGADPVRPGAGRGRQTDGPGHGEEHRRPGRERGGPALRGPAR